MYRVTPTHGDQLSHERMTDAKIARNANTTKAWILFYFIEFYFTTTFLRTHSWLNWVDEDDDEDEVGLKEKPEDTRYIKNITSQ